MPVGIENLGQGLLQGYQFGLQQKRLAQQDARQVAQDERQAVQDAALAKTQDIANRTNEFQLQNGQQTAQRAEQDRLKSQTLNQGIQGSIMAYNSGDYNAAGQQLVDLNNNEVFGNKFKMVFKGSSVKMGKDGKPEIGEDGRPVVEYNMESTDASGKPTPFKITHEDFTVASMHQLDPIANLRKQQDAQTAAALKVTDRKGALADAKDLAGFKSQLTMKEDAAKAEREWNKLVLQYGDKNNNLTANGRALLQTPVEEDDGYGGKKTTYRLDNNKAIAFFKYAKANGLKANDKTAQDWIANDMPGFDKGGNGAKSDPNALPPAIGLNDEPSKKFLSSEDFVLPAAKPSAVKESKPNPEKPKPKPAQQGKGNAGTKLPTEYMQDLSNAIPSFEPAPMKYPKGTTFFSRDSLNPLDQTQKVGTR